MGSVIAQILLLMVAMVLTSARRPFIPGKAKPVEAKPTEYTPVTNIVDIERRMADVERSTSAMKQEIQQVTSENQRLQNELQSMSGVMSELDASQQRTAELEVMLRKFENFFGLLYTELPDVFSREMKIEKRMSALNEYIGNREAELMALRGSPPVEQASPMEYPVDEELLGTVVRELSSQNEKLKFRLDTMETRMTQPTVNRTSTFNAGTFNAGAKGAGTPDEETAERLIRLERLLALLLAPLLDEDEDLATNNGPVQRIGDSTNQRLSLSSSDKEILTQELNSVRSISSTRKSLFSAAATRHSYGESGVHKVIHFDHVFANKGNHYQEHNSTFICHITGFYFITFSTRSYDHRYLGVNLLLNGDRVTSVSGEPDPEKNQMMTQSVVLHLVVGDQLWLTISPSDAYAVYSDHSKYCTFSGFLIFKGS